MKKGSNAASKINKSYLAFDILAIKARLILDQGAKVGYEFATVDINFFFTEGPNGLSVC